MDDNSKRKALEARGFRFSEEYSESKQSDYVARMVAEIKADPNRPSPRPVSTIQCASMQAIMDRDPAKDAEHWNRPMPENWKADKEAMDALLLDPGNEELQRAATGQRELPLDQVNHVEATRRRPKNSLGQSELSSVTTEKRERGINVFRFSPPADLSKERPERIKKMVGYESRPISIEQQDDIEKRYNDPLDESGYPKLIKKLLEWMRS